MEFPRRGRTRLRLSWPGHAGIGQVWTGPGLEQGAECGDGPVAIMIAVKARRGLAGNNDRWERGTAGGMGLAVGRTADAPFDQRTDSFPRFKGIVT